MPAHRIHPAIYIALLICTIIIACGPGGLRKEEMLGFFPLPMDVPGWATKGSAAHYERTSMPLILTGERESMREFGVAEAVVSEYSSINEPERVISVTIFRATTPLDAFGLVARATGFRGRKNIPEGFEDCGVSGKGDFVFRKREYYVEVSLRAAYQGSNKDVVMFSQQINEAMKGLLPDPAEVVYMPGQQHERKGLIYCKKGCGGLLPVPDAYVRIISHEGAEKKYFMRSGPAGKQ
jgi:hypothetical protein